MTAREVYDSWLAHPGLDPQIREQLEAIQGDEKEIVEYPVKDLKFKTRRKKTKVTSEEIRELKDLEDKGGTSKLD